MLIGVKDKEKYMDTVVKTRVIKRNGEEVTFDQIVQNILEEYDVEESVAREDIREFLDTLITGGILTGDPEDGEEQE